MIIGDSETGKTESLMLAFGRFVQSFGGVYHTAVDVGATVADMDIVRRETKFAHCYSGGIGDPSRATSLGVFLSIKAAVEQRFATDDLSKLRVAVQGFGSVGRRLCEHLCKAGSANNQLAEARHGEELRRRGILYAPDYVVNSGGLISVTCG